MAALSFCILDIGDTSLRSSVRAATTGSFACKERSLRMTHLLIIDQRDCCAGSPFLFHVNQWLGLRQDLANAGAGHVDQLERFLQRIGDGRSSRDEQAARGLRIEEQGF
jgi:hypothetical protein